MFHRLARLTALMVLALAALGCLPPTGAATPQEAARRSVLAAEPEAAPTFEVAGQRAFEDEVIVLYRFIRPARNDIPTMTVFGHTVVGQGALGWRARSGATSGREGVPDAARLIDFSFNTSGNAGVPTTIVYGQVLAPEVAAVEATFDTGETVRDAVADEIFALAGRGAQAVCEVRALAADGRVLHTDSLRPPADALKNPAPGGGCAPETP